MHIHLEHRAPRVEVSRRGFFSFGGAVVAFSAAIGVGVTAIADAKPGASDGQSPFRIAEAAYLAAVARYNSLPLDLEHTDLAAFRHEEAHFFDAVIALEEAPIADWQEFADAFKYGSDDGASLLGDELQLKLLADVKRLAGAL